MSREFDPYYKWLGIRPEEQPPNHYRLLAIGMFESDPDVIASAADQRMGHVRMFQTGKHSEISQRILNEIAAARICLLNDQRKAQYDAELRAAIAATAASVLTGSPAPPAPHHEPADDPSRLVPGFSSNGLELPFSTAEPEPAFLSSLPQTSEEPPVVSMPAAGPLDLGNMGTGQPPAVPARRTAVPSYRRTARRKSASWLPYVISGGAAVVLAVVALVWGVSNKSDSGGGQKAAVSQQSIEPKPPRTTQREKPELRSRASLDVAASKDGRPSSKSDEDSDSSSTKNKPTVVTSSKPNNQAPSGAEASLPVSPEGEKRIKDSLAKAKKPEEFVAVAQAGMDLTGRAEAAGNRQLAVSVAGWALSAARKAEDTELVRKITLQIIKLRKEKQ